LFRQSNKNGPWGPQPSGFNKDTGDFSILRTPATPASPDRENRDSRDGPRINSQIRVPRVRLVDVDGEMIGVVTIQEALTLADQAGLDLVEVAAQADPPVCKILDYGKFRYEEQKKKAEARKNQKIVEIKEIKIRPNIDDHDYEVKLRNARRFLEEGDKVKVTLRFRGREMAHQALNSSVIERMRGDLEDIARVEQFPRTEGRQTMMVLGPK